MPKQFSVNLPFWVLLIIVFFLPVIPSFVFANYPSDIFSISTGDRQYTDGELLDAVFFPVTYLDSAGDKQGRTDRKVQTPPIRHFEGATAKNFKEKMAHKKYHQICDRKSPQGLQPCEEANWKFKQAKACLQAREAWEAQWGRPDTYAPHERALSNVRARLRNASADRERFCGMDQRQDN
ncbi:hypothetical protein [Microbulbifer sp. VAAF005]|uniref:hypothetical protein n=1 Tax=Microbulbifer sp. VAAF005 TaxID=3034230 RepID=UPI0024ADEA3C|nr:hypothetical protein [Microbulbifer sp. VAAF005]WHI46766.1 hypothetical protein P0078_24230 [Microbulbifer sp. VAAF005]